MSACADSFAGVTVAIYEVGCALGALSCAITGDILGRRKTIFMAGIFAIIGIIMQASAFSLVQLIVGRAVTGVYIASWDLPVSEGVQTFTNAGDRAWRRSIHSYDSNVRR